MQDHTVHYQQRMLRMEVVAFLSLELPPMQRIRNTLSNVGLRY